MKDFTPQTLARITGGTVVGTLPDEEISFVTLDSREAAEGCLFAAIAGSQVDGHNFMAQVARQGAACVLCSRPVPCPAAQIVVEDVPAALGVAARWYRSRFSIPFIGVTGSVGKTTAKEMIASILSVKYSTLRTEKNFNNELGVPLTLFKLREDHEAAVVEMGISNFGEMTRLTRMVKPDIGVFTLIGDAHLEFLGDRQGVLRAKSEIVEGIPPEGVVIVNGDDPLLKNASLGREKVTFGLGRDCAVRALSPEVEGTQAMRCVIVCGQRKIQARIPAYGEHMLYAALAGAAVGLRMGLSDEEIAQGIDHYRTVGSRGRLVDTGRILILDDCYNANPTSVRSALADLRRLPGRHVAVLGDMRELGENSARLHRQIGEEAAAVCELVLTCGPESGPMAEGAGEKGTWFPDREQLLQALPVLIQESDTVLVKASRAMGFEKVVEQLQQEMGQD